MLHAILSYPKLAVAVVFGVIFAPIAAFRLIVATFTGRITLAPIFTKADADVRNEIGRFAYLFALTGFMASLTALGVYVSAKLILREAGWL